MFVDTIYVKTNRADFDTLVENIGKATDFIRIKELFIEKSQVFL